MKKKLISALLGVSLLAACGGDDGGERGIDNAGKKPSERVKCNSSCQKANDVFLLPGTYTDYFVADSGDSKDGIVAVYTDIPSGIEGVTCSVFKTFDDGDAVAMAVVCPNAQVFSGSQTQDFPEEDDQ